MKAILLAAGEGIRLLPVTATRPKHLIRIGGKPILEHCLNALKANGVNEAVIIYHYLGAAIRDYFGDGSNFGMKLEYVLQEKVLGTGNAASIAEPFVNEDFLLVYGDLLFSSEAVKKVLEAYKSVTPGGAVMAVVLIDKPENYGIIEMGKDCLIKQVVEKPTIGKAPSNLANAGIYIFENNIFNWLRKVKRSVRGEWELTDAINLMVKNRKKVLVAEIAKGDWFDIGKPWDLLEANAWALRRMEHKVLGCVEEGAHLLGSVTVEKTARIRSGAYIEGPCYIGEGADVGPNCYVRPCTTLERNVRIGNACEIKNCIIMEGTHVGHLSYVGDSVLCEKCNLGAGTISANLRLDDRSVKMIIKDKLVDSGRRKLGAILGDNVKTGIGALLMPGVKIGNDCWVGAGFVLERDLPPNTIVLLKNNWISKEKKR